MSAPVAVFDFDGTICDDLVPSIEVLNSLAERYAFKKIDISQISEVRHLTAKQMMGKLGISPWRVPFLLRHGRQALREAVPTLKPIQGMREILSAIRARCSYMGILTSNSEINVCSFLKRNGIEPFDFIHTGSSLFGKGRLLKRLLRRESLAAKNVWYVGDEVRDIEAAREAGVRCISVSWGFNSRELLSSHLPDNLIDEPSQLIDAILY
jgi:phosphoglycolate phosphatase